MTIATETGALPQLSLLISNDEMKQLIREICALDAPPSTRAARLGDKGTFPKLLALDMNAWIYLSRAHYGRAEHPSHVAALESIRRAAAPGGVVAPVFPMNLTEVTDISAGDRRARLAAFMVSLSGNHSIVYSGTIRDREIHDAIQRCYLGRTQSSDIRTRILHWGVAAAVGIGGIEISKRARAECGASMDRHFPDGRTRAATSGKFSFHARRSTLDARARVFGFQNYAAPIQDRIRLRA